MPRPTVNDIARVAGVSLATVDRVLNERPGVRPITITRVNEAIQSLGYVRDLSAANLARQRHYELAFILPDTEGQFVAALARAVENAARASHSDRTAVHLFRAAAEDPHALVRQLDALDVDTIDGVAIMAPETPPVRDAIARLKQAGVSVVTIVSDHPSTERDQFIGIDNIAAGRTAGTLLGRFLGREGGRVLVLVGSTLARDSIERRLGFDRIMAESFPHVEVLPSVEGHDDPETIRRVLDAALDAHSDIRGIYSLAAGHRTLTGTLKRRSLASELVMLAHELTPHARESLMDGTFDAVITQNLGHVVRSSLRVLRAKSDGLQIDASQETIRIEIVLRENLPPPAVDDVIIPV